MNGFSNRPKILKGAFVEHGYSIPPLIVPFQFNPESLSRERSNNFQAPGGGTKKEKGDKLATIERRSLREFHWKPQYHDLMKLKEEQDVEIGSESISFDIRLDATDKLNEGDLIAEQFGIAPQLSTLELMMYPEGESVAGEIASQLGISAGYTWRGSKKPPMILFIWGRKKVLPVNINSMRITEEEFSSDLNPIRATISVSLTVIEGPNIPYFYSKMMKEAMSALNLANLPEVANVIVPL